MVNYIYCDLVLIKRTPDDVYGISHDVCYNEYIKTY